MKASIKQITLDIEGNTPTLENDQPLGAINPLEHLHISLKNSFRVFLPIGSVLTEDQLMEIVDGDIKVLTKIAQLKSQF